MHFQKMVEAALEIKDKYDKENRLVGYDQWGAAEYMQGLAGDIGDLAKLIMAKNNLRHNDDVDTKISHELSDCLWSLICIAYELHIDLEQAFMQTMEELSQKLDLESMAP